MAFRRQAGYLRRALAPSPEGPRRPYRSQPFVELLRRRVFRSGPGRPAIATPTLLGPMPWGRFLRDGSAYRLNSQRREISHSVPRLKPNPPSASTYLRERNCALATTLWGYGESTHRRAPPHNPLPTWGHLAQMAKSVVNSMTDWSFLKGDRASAHKQLPIGPKFDNLTADAHWRPITGR